MSSTVDEDQEPLNGPAQDATHDNLLLDESPLDESPLDESPLDESLLDQSLLDDTERAALGAERERAREQADADDDEPSPPVIGTPPGY